MFVQAVFAEWRHSLSIWADQRHLNNFLIMEANVFNSSIRHIKAGVRAQVDLILVNREADIELQFPLHEVSKSMASSPGWDDSPWQFNPPHFVMTPLQFAGNHFYSRVGRGRTTTKKCLAQHLDVGQRTNHCYWGHSPSLSNNGGSVLLNY